MTSFSNIYLKLKAFTCLLRHWVFLLAIVFCTSCAELDRIGSSISENNNPPPGEPASPLSLKISSVQELTLGAFYEVKIDVTAAADSEFKESNVELSIDRADLNKVDPNEVVNLFFNIRKLLIKPGKTVTYTLLVDVATNAPSFKDINVNVIAKPDPLPENFVQGQASFRLSILPVLELYLKQMGANSHVWAIANSKQFQNSMMPINVKSHPQGLTVRWINNSTQAHQITFDGTVLAFQPITLTVPTAGSTTHVFETLVPATEDRPGTFRCTTHGTDPTHTIHFDSN